MRSLLKEADAARVQHLIDSLLYSETQQIIKLRLVTLEMCVLWQRTKTLNFRGQNGFSSRSPFYRWACHQFFQRRLLSVWCCAHLETAVYTDQMRVILRSTL